MVFVRFMSPINKLLEYLGIDWSFIYDEFFFYFYVLFLGLVMIVSPELYTIQNLFIALMPFAYIIANDEYEEMDEHCLLYWM